MELKKLIAIGISLGLSLGSVGCGNKTDTVKDQNTTNNTTQDNTGNTNTSENATNTNTEYSKVYSGLYTNNITPLMDYSMYRNVEDVNNSYKDKDYPGNEKYVSEVKAAYEDSKEKLQAFVNGLKNDAKTEDKKLKSANDELIAEGEKLISEIDTKIKKLDEIPKDAYNKNQDEFIKFVDDTTKVENGVADEFDKMIEDMNNMLGINTKPSTKTTK